MLHLVRGTEVERSGWRWSFDYVEGKPIVRLRHVETPRACDLRIVDNGGTDVVVDGGGKRLSIVQFTKNIGEILVSAGDVLSQLAAA